MRFLFVDRIVQSSPGEWIRGIKHITKEDAYFSVDAQGRACFLSSLIGETLGQLAAWNVMQANDFSLRPVAGLVDCAKLHRPAYVGETLLLESNIDSLDDQVVQYHSVAKVGKELVFSIEGALGPLLPMEDFIKTAEIQRQFTEIYRPGDWSAISTLSLTSQDFKLDELGVARVASLSFDRILESEAGVHLLAEKRITIAAPYFPDHFPRKPVLPMTVLLESKLNLAKEFLLRANIIEHYQVLELRKIKMNEFVLPGDVLLCYVKVKKKTEQELILAFRSEVDGKRVCVVDVVLGKV